jgi:hypothetical protein
VSGNSVVIPHSAIRNPHSMHTIRLRGPWEIEQSAGRMGTARCVRHFNKPTGLESGERVWLVIEGMARTAAISFNGAFVGQASSWSSARFNITPQLMARNRIEIELPSPTGADPRVSLGEVRLEIEPPE